MICYGRSFTFHCWHFYSFPHHLHFSSCASPLHTGHLLTLLILSFRLFPCHHLSVFSSSSLRQSFLFTYSCFTLFFSPHSRNIQSTLGCFISPLHLSNSLSLLSSISSFLSVQKEYLSCSEYLRASSLINSYIHPPLLSLFSSPVCISLYSSNIQAMLSEEGRGREEVCFSESCHLWQW